MEQWQLPAKDGLEERGDLTEAPALEPWDPLAVPLVEAASLQPAGQARRPEKNRSEKEGLKGESKGEPKEQFKEELKAELKEEREEIALPSLPELEEALAAFLESQGGRAGLSAVADGLAKRFPGFKASAYGCGKLSSLIQRKMGHRVEILPSREGGQSAAALRSGAEAPGPQAPLERVCLRRDLMRALNSLTAQETSADSIKALCEGALRDGTALRSGDDALIDTGLLDRREQPLYAWLERSSGPDGQEWDLRSFCRRGQGFYGRLMDQRFPQLQEKAPHEEPAAQESQEPKAPAPEPAREDLQAVGHQEPAAEAAGAPVGASTEEVQQALAAAQDFQDSGSAPAQDLPAAGAEPDQAEELGPQPRQSEESAERTSLPSLPELQDLILQLIESSPGGKITVANLSEALRERIPGFRPGCYGCSKMISLLTRKMDGQVSLRKDHRHGQTYAIKSPCGAQTGEVQRALEVSSSTGKALERPSPLAATVLGSFSIIQEDHCRALAALALAEPWHYGEADGTFPILRDYLRNVYSRLRHQKKVLLSPDRQYAALNTGLLSRNYEPIYAFFQRGRPGGPQWDLKDFCLAGQGLYGKQLTRHFYPLPEEASSGLDPQELLYDRSLGAPAVDWTHILINRLGRIPLEALRASGLQVPGGERFTDMASVRQCQDQIRENPNAYRRLKALFQAALDLTMKRLQYDFSLAAPVYRASNQTVALALPLWLLEDRRADLGLIVERIDANSYLGHTVYPLDWVYSASRPLFQPSQSWLAPRKMEPFPLIAEGLQGPAEKALPEGHRPFWKGLALNSQPSRGLAVDPEEPLERDHGGPLGLLRRLFRRR